MRTSFSLNIVAILQFQLRLRCRNATLDINSLFMWGRIGNAVLDDKGILKRYGCRKIPSTRSLIVHTTFCGQDFHEQHALSTNTSQHPNQSGKSIEAYLKSAYC